MTGETRDRASVRSAPAFERSPYALAMVGVWALLLFVYPLAVEWAVSRFGVRTAGAVLLVGCAVAARAVRGHTGELPGIGGVPRFLGLALLAAAVFTGDPVHLRLVVAAVYLGLAAAFRASLQREDSLLERLVRYIEPAAPLFVRSYCRKVTRLWAIFFAANAAALAFLAVAGPEPAWRAWSGWGVYAQMAAITVVEFFVRKTWFRYYYYGGPFDRLWSSLFPAENTERGRRSAEYIRQVKAGMGS